MQTNRISNSQISEERKRGWDQAIRRAETGSPPIRFPLYEHQLDEFISQAEAARFRGVSKQAIANLIQRGRLTTVKIAGRTLLLRSEVETFAPQPKLGRPSKNSALKKKSKASKVTPQKR
ncbi:MAG TPA: helix-turn-helix domain-containing protein [Edaphobacter sp.]|jgi:hypothetical protein|nr:helix-turn-helix domain-containing protein [Edaphobacter sp.]